MEEFSCPSECEEAEERDRKSSSRDLDEKSSGVAKVGVLWSGSACKTPLILFRPNAILGLDSPVDHPISAPQRLTFKITCNEHRLVRTLLFSHGFSEVPLLGARFNVYWSGMHIQMSDVRRLMPHQRVNHFPRSYMITRKDRLYMNISRMQQSKGMKHFNIIPMTFALPEETAQFRVRFRKYRGVWIVKPVSSSRGRGISLINHPNQVKGDEPMVVSQYIDNPLCVNGYKFDLRLYVAVTSFNPLKIYIYEDGLARFATEQYEGAVQLDNLCMHLTNYSVNKKNSQYVRCDSTVRDDFGSKWSMSALLRHLLREGRNVAEMMMRVEDLVIKALIAGEFHISAACDVFQAHKGNCFELYGFDILIDETLRPWLLEINLSPSLGCDTPFDLRLKSNLIADLLTLVGVPLCDPHTRETPKPPKTRHRTTAYGTPFLPSSSLPGRLTREEAAMVRACREEYGRRCGFVRVFPSHDSWNLYSSFLEHDGLNYILHRELYPNNIMKIPRSPASLSDIIAKRVDLTSVQPPSVCDSPDGLIPLERVAVYLRKLESGAKFKPLWDSVCELVCTSSRPGQRCPHPESTALSHQILAEPLQHVVANITKLSKVQACKMFATYLGCVEQRLSQEASDVDQKSLSSHDTTNFQMVISFLKCATQTLSSRFTLVEPNPDLPLKDRKGMLARQLAEFITQYNEETTELATKPTEALGLPAKVIDAALLKASEKDLEKVLAAYARHSHSASSLFGTSIVSQGIECTSTSTQHLPIAPTSSSSVLPRSGRHDVLSRDAMSRVLQRQSRLPKTPPTLSSAECLRESQSHSNSTANSQTTSSTSVQRMDVPSFPPPYNSEHYSDELMILSSSPPSQKDSLHALTQSPVDSRTDRERGTAAVGLPPQGPGRGIRGSGGSRGERNRRGKSGRLMRRTLSTQSLQSISSETSVQSLKSIHSVDPLPKSSPSRAGRPQSASIVSKMKSYVSPYAQPGQIKSVSSTTKHLSISKTKQGETARPRVLHCRSSKPQSAGEDSITEVLHRLTVKQMARHRMQSSAATTRPCCSRLAWTKPRTENIVTCSLDDV